MSDERFPTAWSGQTAVVTAVREVDITNAERLRDALLTALNDGAAALVVDLTMTTFIDSAGVTALVRAWRRAAAGHAVVRLAVITPPVLRVLSLVGIDQLIEVYPSVAAARASLPDGLHALTGRGGLVPRGCPAARRRSGAAARRAAPAGPELRPPSSTGSPGRRPG